MSEHVDVIFFSAHPDDSELACGGTAAKLLIPGDRIAKKVLRFISCIGSLMVDS